jgi:phosphohistidine swiveling domain-containing protein
MKTEEIIKKYNLNKRTYTNKGFHGILSYFFVVGEQALKPMKKYFGVSHSITIYRFSDNYGEWYWCSEDMIKLRNWFISKVVQNPKYLDKILVDWHKALKKFDNMTFEIDKTDLSKLSYNNLYNLYLRWYKSYLNEYGISIGIQDSFSMHADLFLIPHFKTVLGEKNFKKYYMLLLSPVNESFFVKEYMDRLKLLSKLKSSNLNSIQELLGLHSKQYHWIQNNYAKAVYLDKNFFIKELKSIEKLNPKKEIEKLDKNIKKNILDKKRIIFKLNLDEKSRILIKITEVFAYMQDERKKYVLIANYYHSLFLTEFSKRLNIQIKDLEYSYIYELKDAKIDIKKLRERKKSVLVINTNKGYEIFSGKISNDIYNKIFKIDHKESFELKGFSANLGKVKGYVKIVNKIHDIINVCEGDILVTSMTRPEMVIAMKKASAIVTDEGGITSHAAIVSRELKIPCIIGTKIATKVFKDNDLVEVDANKGVVRKIE